MRILYLCADLGVPVLGHKGASIHVRELVAALRRAGHDVVVAASTLTRSPWERPAELDAPVEHVPPSPATVAAAAGVKELRDLVGATTMLPAELRRILHDRELGRELLRRFERHPPDVVYERAAVYSTAGTMLASALGVPHVVEYNAPLALEHSRYRSAGVDDLAAAAERRLLSHAHAVIAVSEGLRDHAIALGAEPARVVVRPNGVDPARFHPGPADPALRARLGLDDAPVVGFVGGLRPWHGVEALPSLLERLTDTRPDARLLVAGDGPLRDALVTDLQRRGLRERAVLTGPVAHDDVPAVLRLLDVAVAPYPPLDHAFYFSPLKLFEYMACALPVVAPAVGQIAGLVRDGDTGLLYPPGDDEALATACARVLGDRALAARLGAAAHEEVHEQYTWDRNAGEVVALAGVGEAAA